MDQRIFDDPGPGRNEDSRSVTLTGRDLRDATRLLQKLLERDAETSVSPASPREITPMHRKRFVDHARRIIHDRRRRTQLFGSAMFGEPGWDMLLILYVEEDINRLPVTRLATTSGSSLTTGLRWFEYLVSQQLVRRLDHPTDRRIDLVELTDKGRIALDSYFSETLTRGR